MCLEHSLQRSSSFNVLRNTPASNLQQSFSADVINEATESLQGGGSDVEDDETGAKISQGVRTNQEDGVVQVELSVNDDPAQDPTNCVNQTPRRTLVGYLLRFIQIYWLMENVL